MKVVSIKRAQYSMKWLPSIRNKVSCCLFCHLETCGKPAFLCFRFRTIWSHAEQKTAITCCMTCTEWYCLVLMCVRWKFRFCNWFLWMVFAMRTSPLTQELEWSFALTKPWKCLWPKSSGKVWITSACITERPTVKNINWRRTTEQSRSSTVWHLYFGSINFCSQRLNGCDGIINTQEFLLAWTTTSYELRSL